jgi:hypothetical protein
MYTGARGVDGVRRVFWMSHAASWLGELHTSTRGGHVKKLSRGCSWSWTSRVMRAYSWPGRAHVQLMDIVWWCCLVKRWRCGLVYACGRLALEDRVEHPEGVDADWYDGPGRDGRRPCDTLDYCVPASLAWIVSCAAVQGQVRETPSHDLIWLARHLSRRSSAASSS